MTENEAKTNLELVTNKWESAEEMFSDSMDIIIDQEFVDTLYIAIKALGELPQYRAIGTPEECREAVTKQISRHPVDKTKPDSGYGNYYENARVIVCPNCNGRLKLKSKGKYCDKCGQKLSWGD